MERIPYHLSLQRGFGGEGEGEEEQTSLGWGIYTPHYGDVRPTIGQAAAVSGGGKRGEIGARGDVGRGDIYSNEEEKGEKENK